METRSVALGERLFSDRQRSYQYLPRGGGTRATGDELDRETQAVRRAWRRHHRSALGVSDGAGRSELLPLAETRIRRPVCEAARQQPRRRRSIHLLCSLGSIPALDDDALNGTVSLRTARAHAAASIPNAATPR